MLQVNSLVFFFLLILMCLFFLFQFPRNVNSSAFYFVFMLDAETFWVLNLLFDIFVVTEPSPYCGALSNSVQCLSYGRCNT